MKAQAQGAIERLYRDYPALSALRGPVQAALEEIIACYRRGNKLLVFGNGGSAADAEHIVGELMKVFKLKRPLAQAELEAIEAAFPQDAAHLCANLQQPLPAIALVGQSSLFTAFANDIAADLVFAQQMLGYAREGDIALAISTSGNSANVVYAAQIARLKKARVIAMTGRSGGRLRELADVLLDVPADETFRVQEYHLPVYHALCAAVEAEFFAEG